MNEESSLITLFTSSFLAATLLPGGSEVVLVGVLMTYPELFTSALGVATIGNTLGGMSSYLIGRFLPDEKAIIKKTITACEASSGFIVTAHQSCCCRGYLLLAMHFVLQQAGFAFTGFMQFYSLPLAN